MWWLRSFCCGLFFSLESYLNDYNLKGYINYADPFWPHSYSECKNSQKLSSGFRNDLKLNLKFISTWKAANVFGMLPLFKDLPSNLRGANFLNEPRLVHPWTLLESNRPSPLPCNFIKEFNMESDSEQKGILTGIAISFEGAAFFLPLLPPFPLLSGVFRKKSSQSNSEKDVCERPVKISRQNHKDIGDCSITQKESWQELDYSVLKVIFAFCGFEHNVSPQEVVVFIPRDCVNFRPTGGPSARMILEETTESVPILTTQRNTVSILCRRWCYFYRRWYNDNLCESTISLCNEILGERYSSNFGCFSNEDEVASYAPRSNKCLVENMIETNRIPSPSLSSPLS